MLRNRFLVSILLVSSFLVTMAAGAAAAPPPAGTEKLTLTSATPDGKRAPMTTAPPVPESLAQRKQVKPEPLNDEKIKQRRRDAASMGKNPGTARAAAVTPKERADACDQMAAGNKNEGYVINHHSYCMWTPLLVVKEICPTGQACVVTGTALFRLTIVGYDVPGQRHMTLAFRTSRWELKGDPTLANEFLRIALKCTDYGVDCGGTSIAFSKPISLWMAGTNPESYTFKTGPGGLDGNDVHKLAWFTFRAGAHVVGAITPELEYGNYFRCDSATYMNKKHGCVFDNTISWFDFDYTSVKRDPTSGDIIARADEQAMHIYDAQHRPEITFPMVQNKVLPGAWFSYKPLHRAKTDRGDSDASRTKVQAVCKDQWGPDYATRGLECDEYPFASTNENAALCGGDDCFSARAITKSSNRWGGEMIIGFYEYERVLRDDPFYVDVINVPLNVASRSPK